MDIQKKNLMNTNLTFFVECLYESIYKALHPAAVRKGFVKAFITLEDNSKYLEKRIEEFLSSIPESNDVAYIQRRFNISDKILMFFDFI
jgi:4'-phosphopantetheinyl transferase EntD